MTVAFLSIVQNKPNGSLTLVNDTAVGDPASL
jgi:hypothetical protein